MMSSPDYFRNKRLRPYQLRLAAGVFLGALTQVSSPDAYAVAFRLPNQDPEAIARGNAFTATADNPSAIYYNPAGITQLEGHNISAGMYFVSAGTEFKSVTGAKAETDKSFQPVPQLYYVYSPENSPLSFGLGVYAAYGLALDWRDNPPFRNLAQEGSVLYATVNPVVAYQIHPTLSLAIGPTINYSEAEFERGIGILPGDQFRFKGDGMDYGFNAGLFWHPHEQWAFGLNYRYATEVEYKGHSETFPYAPETRTSGSIRYPQFVVGGVSYRPTTNWNFEVNIDWTDWDNVNEIVFENTSFGNLPFPLNYTSGFMYEFGVTRRLPKDFFVSAGYFFSENSSPEENFNPIVPDADLHLGSFGFGRKGDRFSWAVAYHFGFNPEREIRNGTAADGTYETLNHAFNIAARFHF